MKKYDVKIGFQMTCAPTVFESVSFDAETPEQAIKKARLFGEIFKREFRDEHCVVFISDVRERR